MAGAAFSICNAAATTLILRHAPPDGLVLASSLDISFARGGSVAMIALFGVLPAGPTAAALLAASVAALACAVPFLHDRPSATVPG